MRRDRSRRRVLAATALLGATAGCQGLLDGDDTSTDGADDGGDTGNRDGSAANEPAGADGTPSASGGGDETPPASGDGGSAGDTVQVGEGSYLASVPGGSPAPSDPALAEGVDPPVPTNDWWTTLCFDDYGARLWSNPLVTDVGPDGVSIGAPQEWAVTDSGPAGANFAHLPWRGDLTLGPADGTTTDRTLVSGWGDWSVDYRLAGTGIEVTQARGSPFLFCTVDSPVAVTGGGEADAEVSVFAEEGATLGVTVDGRPYGLYAPSGSPWSSEDGRFTNALDGDRGSGYCTAAALPDASVATLDAYSEYAHGHVVNTRVEWTYDREAAAVRTTYRFETEAREGDESGTITALYPHQHRHTDATLREETYVSPRGPMHTVAGAAFETTHDYQGILPVLPGGDEETATLLDGASMDIDPGPESPSDGVYWRGKNVTRLTALAGVAERVGDVDTATNALEPVRTELSRWFDAERTDGVATQQVFAYNDAWGTLQGYPAGFGAADALNDHHFHYGQFVRGAAAVARRDAGWADDFGGMVEHLIRDYANPDRGDDRYPFLRNFDPYAGHSWAGGTSGDHGNNQEASSEAIHAYAAMIYWGAYTGNDELRDAGVYLYTHETTAAREYWFDERGRDDDGDGTLPNVDGWEYGYAAQVWGSGVHWTTWWTDEPEAIYLINALPIGGHSLYLGLDDDAAGETYDELLANDDAPSDYWPAILAKYRALSDPEDARQRWEAYPGGEPEMGTSRAHARHWIHSLSALGSPDPGVTADHPLAAVFERDGTRTYVADNPGDDPLAVTFSDGTTLTVPPNTLATE